MSVEDARRCLGGAGGAGGGRVVVIEDILEPELQYVATSDAEVRVIVGGTAVTGIAHIDKAKNTLTVNVPTDIIAANLGAEIRVENIRVQIRERDASGAAVSLARHINLANGKGYSVKEIIETAKKVSGKEIKVVFSDRRAGDPPVLVGGTKKAEALLGWKPAYDLTAIMEHAWNWQQKMSFS